MSYQKIIIQGNIGKIEQRFLQDGKSVVNFSVAVSERYKDKNGQQHETTEWFNCCSFGKQSEIIYQYFQKGSPILVEGKSKTRQWQDNNGQTRYNTDIMVKEFSFVGGGQNSGHSGQNAGYQSPQTQAQQGPAQGQPQPQNQNMQGGTPGDLDEEDIPFVPFQRGTIV